MPKFHVEVVVRQLHVVEVIAENWGDAYRLANSEELKLPEPTRVLRQGDVLLSDGHISVEVAAGAGGWTVIILKAPDGREFDDATEKEILGRIGERFKVSSHWNGSGCGTMSISVGHDKAEAELIEKMLSDLVLPVHRRTVMRMAWIRKEID